MRIRGHIKRIAEAAGLSVAAFRPLAHDPFAAQKALCPRPRLIFDVGAYLGDVTQKYVEIFPSANVVAFEPFPASAAVTRQRFAEHPKVEVCELAIGEQSGRRTLHANQHAATNSLLAQTADSPAVQAGSQIQVECRRLDDLADNPDILKLDVQGGELGVVRGGRAKLLSGQVKVIFTEVWFDVDYVGAPLFHELAAELADCGYALHGLYDLKHRGDGRLWFADALFVRLSDRPN